MSERMMLDDKQACKLCFLPQSQICVKGEGIWVYKHTLHMLRGAALSVFALHVSGLSPGFQNWF